MIDNKDMHIAILLAGGRGKRMNSDIPKQYMNILGFPELYYPLKTLQESFINKIIIVASEDSLDYCRTEIADRYGFDKVAAYAIGGKERYNSVYNGLMEVNKITSGKCYIYIHDGARPCLTQDILLRCKADVETYGACVAAMPVKDTIKIADANDFAIETPARSTLWQIQTPQVFDFEKINRSYNMMITSNQVEGITDDAMVLEKFGDCHVKLTKGSYNNIKITTPEDILLVENILKNQ